MVTPGEARKLLRDYSYGGKEEVSVTEALGRVLAEDIASQEDVPPFPRSTMDGYAVSTKDTFGASSSQPVYLRVTGSIEMGRPASQSMKSGEAVEIPTGGMLPPGADAVVMMEHARLLDDGVIEIARPHGPWENVMKAGEDFIRGEIIAARGRRLRPQEVGALAGAGISAVSVLRRPVVGLVSTGDELVPLGTDPSPGQIRSVNPYSLGSAIHESGGVYKDLGHVPDSLEFLREKIDYGVKHCDFTLISGGSSLGTRDWTLKALESFEGSRLLFHGIAVAPGKPTVAASLGSKLAVGLPGHPASAFIVFTVFVRPLLQGRFEIEWSPSIRAVLSRNVASAAGREEYVRVTLERDGDTLHAVPLLGKSGALKSLVRADGLIRIEMEREGLDKGEEVNVLLL